MSFIQKLTMIICLSLLLQQLSWAREITVKYRDTPVDVSTGFIEYNLIESSLVNELFYNSSHMYALVRLKDTFYHYCGIPNKVVDEWSNSNSLGQFYQRNVKGRYDCRNAVVPTFRN